MCVSRDERISRFTAVIFWNDNLQDHADDTDTHFTNSLWYHCLLSFVVFIFSVVACSLKTCNPVNERFKDFE